MQLLWTHFLNSQWRDPQISDSPDQLSKPELQQSFLSRWGMRALDPPTDDQMAMLKRLRSVLDGLARDLAGGLPPSPSALVKLNRFMAGAPVIREISQHEAGYQLKLMPTQFNWPHVAAEIAASFAQTLTERDPARVRICDNPGCRWVFYDETRSRTKRYCDDRLCGNLMKVRRFRARQKAAAEGEESADM